MAEAVLRFTPKWARKEEFISSFLPLFDIEQPFLSGRYEELTILFPFVCCVTISKENQNHAHQASSGL